MKAVFTTKQTSAYDDVPEVRYHFPRTYLRQVRDAVGDFIVYYEPRRTSHDVASRGGRQSYFAIARLERIEPDDNIPEHYYAYVSDYVGFDFTVPFNMDQRTFEAILQKEDGSTNKGAFGRAVRSITDEEFSSICQAGFVELNASGGEAPISHRPEGFDEPVVEFEHPRSTVTITRALRDRAFTRQIQQAYQQRCAFTGLRLINGGGRPEAQQRTYGPCTTKARTLCAMVWRSRVRFTGCSIGASSPLRMTIAF